MHSICLILIFPVTFQIVICFVQFISKTTLDIQNKLLLKIFSFEDYLANLMWNSLLFLIYLDDSLQIYILFIPTNFQILQSYHTFNFC